MFWSSLVQNLAIALTPYIGYNVATAGDIIFLVFSLTAMLCIWIITIGSTKMKSRFPVIITFFICSLFFTWLGWEELWLGIITMIFPISLLIAELVSRRAKEH